MTRLVSNVTEIRIKMASIKPNNASRAGKGNFMMQKVKAARTVRSSAMSVSALHNVCSAGLGDLMLVSI